MPATLGEADRLRTEDPARALRIYAALCDQLDPTDEDRIAWICDQVAPTPPPELAPLLRRAAAGEPGVTRRAAVHALATMAWFDGHGEEAERLWLQGLREPAPGRDVLWIRSCLNLATRMLARSCLFEPIVLIGMSRRAAGELHHPYLEACAAVRLSDALMPTGEYDRIEAGLLTAERLLDRIDDEGKRRVILYEIMRMRARLTAVREGPEQALAVRRKQLAWLEAYEHSERPLVASVRISMIALRFKAGTEDRAQLIEELEAIPDEFELGDSWRTEWYWAYGELRMRYALEDLGDRESALYWARELLELYRASSDSMAANAAALARVFARELDAPDDARRAFELASTACLQRIMQAHQASEEIPELAEATPEDWATLAGYRDRLAREQGDLLDAVASHLKKGVPAFDLLARDDFICICAWCRRVRTREQTWLPVAHFLPSDPSPQVSHGICEVCRNRHFPVRPLPIA